MKRKPTTNIISDNEQEPRAATGTEDVVVPKKQKRGHCAKEPRPSGRRARRRQEQEKKRKNTSLRGVRSTCCYCGTKLHYKAFKAHAVPLMDYCCREAGTEAVLYRQQEYRCFHCQESFEGRARCLSPEQAIIFSCKQSAQEED